MKFLLPFFLFLISLSAHGKYLRIVSDLNLRLTEQLGQMYLMGELTLENQGDEEAKDVFPKLSLDQWSLSLSKQNLAQGEKYTWQVSQKISRSLLCLHVSKDCTIALPAAGDFMVHLEKNYRDKNGYPFTVPEVLSLAYKKKDSNNPEWIRTEMSSEQINDTDYRISYVFHDLTNDVQHLGLRYLVPKEVELLTPEIPVDVPAQYELRGSFELRNKKGLEGSDYGIILVAEEKKEEQRRFTWSTAHIKIQKYTPPVVHGILWNWWSRIQVESVFAFLWVALTLAAFGWVYFFWEEPRRSGRGE